MNGKLIPSTGEQHIPLLKEKILIGRQADCDIRIPFSNVSSRHAELRFYKGWWVLVDKRSSNGTRVNGDKIERKRLRPGDEITFARKYTYKIDYKPEGAEPTREDLDVIIKKKQTASTEQDLFSESLLERAGLAKKKNEDDFDPSLFFDDEEEKTDSKRTDLTE